MKITKKDMEKLDKGQVITDTDIDKKYVQRVRNYAQCLKNEDRDYRVTTKTGLLSVERIETITPQRLTDKLNYMRSGEIIHPCDASKYNIVTGTVSALGGGFKVSLVVQVEKL